MVTKHLRQIFFFGTAIQASTCLASRAAAAGLFGGAERWRATGAIQRVTGATGPWREAVNGTYDLWEVDGDGSAAFLARYRGGVGVGAVRDSY